MLFSQLQFWIFFAVVLAAYLVLPHRRQNRMLLVASYVFYGAWDWRFLGLILFSTVVDYLVGLRLGGEEDPRRCRQLLTLSMVTNLGLLGIFKYLGFFVASFQSLAADLGFAADPLVLGIVLPVGISFYTFQTMSYTIDVYRRDLEPCRDFWDFALFVSFFPQLVAGPIERASHLLPEIYRPRQMSWEAAGRGAVLCLTGLIKKIVIADGLAPSVDAVYNGAADPTGAAVLMATWFFAIQIYCDFSGYTDIARGVAKILGFSLMRNFAQPYFSMDPQEFWRRWHISLSSWLRDYLYISLGGNRGGRWRTYRNLFLTMLLGGLWHGAAWTFVLWGAYQGALLCLHRAIVGRRRAAHVVRGLAGRALHLLRVVLFFQVVCYGWLLFRATSFAQVADFTGRLARLSPADLLAVPMPPVPVLCGILFVFLWDLGIETQGTPRFYARWPLAVRGTLYASAVYLLAFGATTATSAFIYFQF